MSDAPITRQKLLDAIREALEPQPYVLALWEGGAAGFDRVDQWSDLDVQMIVQDGESGEAFSVVEDALEELAGIEYRYRIPEPTWHGHSQCIYRLKGASPFMLLDLAVMQEGTEADRFMQFETHGRPNVLFDRNRLVVEEPLDVEAMVARMQDSLTAARARFELFWVMVQKEINRENPIEAFSYYYNFAVQPLHQALRMTYSPKRFFYNRYPHYDLPQTAADRLAQFYYVRDLKDLQEKFEAAQRWFAELANEIDWEEVRAALKD